MGNIGSMYVELRKYKAAKEYMDEYLFENESIRVHYFDYSNYPIYPQLYGEFTHYVSILDLIFNVGDGAKKYMKII